MKNNDKLRFLELYGSELKSSEIFIKSIIIM